MKQPRTSSPKSTMTPCSSSLNPSSASVNSETLVDGNSLKPSSGSMDKTKDNVEKSAGLSPRKLPRSCTKVKGKMSSGKVGQHSSSRSKTINKRSSPSAATKLAGSKGKDVVSTSESESDECEAYFEDYSELCERVAKTMYYTRIRTPTTPRPSLPLTSRFTLYLKSVKI